MHGMGSGPLHDPSGMGGYNVALSPAQDHSGANNLMSSGLPPMSTFRNSAAGPMGGPVTQAGVVQPGPGVSTVQSPSMYSHSPNLGPPPGPGGQTGDALGKALASVSRFSRERGVEMKFFLRFSGIINGLKIDLFR